MLPVTDQGTVPKGAQKTPGVSQQGVKDKPIPTDPPGDPPHPEESGDQRGISDHREGWERGEVGGQ